MASIEIRWTPAAESQVLALHAYIADEDPRAADRQVDLLLRSVEGLALFPGKGRAGRVGGTRELVVTGTPYVAAYRTKGDFIQILAILHGARRWRSSRLLVGNAAATRFC